MIYSRKGISLISLIVTILVIAILASISIPSGIEKINKAKLAAFNENILLVKQETDGYYLSNYEYPVKLDTHGEPIIYSISSNTGLLSKITQKNDQSDIFYVIDLSKIKISDSDLGIGKTIDDYYIYAKKSRNVYYAKGVDIGGIRYYTKNSSGDGIVAVVPTSAATPTPLCTSTPTPTPMDYTGTGTNVADPYIIYTFNGLNMLRTHTTSYFKLGANIDASQTSQPSYNSGKGWISIPNFSGHLDGNGYKISNLYINDSARARVGLFDYILRGSVTNLGLENVNITGINNVGGIVGCGDQVTIEKVYVTGSIKGGNDVGGLAGYITGETDGYECSFIYDCYSRANVTGISYDGGFIGSVQYDGWVPEGGTYVKRCYSTGLISATSSTYIGGFLGFNTVGGYDSISECYWDSDTSLQGSSECASSGSTEEMMMQSTYDGFDFTNVWAMNSSINNGYPYLRIMK